MRLRLFTLSCLAAAMLLTTASLPAQPRVGAIRGRVDVRRVVIPPERRPNPSDLGTPPPREIPDLECGLRNRFEGGLTVEVTRPDRDTRRRILAAKALQRTSDLPTTPRARRWT